MENNKLKVDIFVPLNACSCIWSDYMNRVFTVLQKYTKLIKFQTKDLGSDEARELKLMGNSVVVDGNNIFTNPQQLKQKLPEILKKNGLI